MVKVKRVLRLRRSHLYGTAILLAGFAAGILLAGGLTRPSSGSRSVVAERRGAPDRGSATANVPPGPRLFQSGAHHSFSQLTMQLSGSLGVVAQPLGAGSEAVFGDDAPVFAGTTITLPVLVDVLLKRGAAGLTATEQAWATAAVTASKRRPSFQLFADLERLTGSPQAAIEGVEQLLRASGDEVTLVAGAQNGETNWAPGETVKFFRAVGRGCLLPHSQSAYLLNLMQHVKPNERWGLGAADFTGPVAFQSGAAQQPDGRYIVRQSGIIDVGSGRGVAVSIVASAGGTGTTSFIAGTTMVTDAANWLSRELVLSTEREAPCHAS